MAGPWEKYAGPVYGAPAKTDPLGDEAQRVAITKGRQDIANNDLDVESKRQGIVSSQAGLENQQFNQNKGLREEFAAKPLSKNYVTVAQKVGNALNAPSDAAGDLAVLYAFATSMDPDSVVRESEQEMAKRTASTVERLKAQYNMISEGDRLPPEVRHKLTETMRTNLQVINQAYNQQRGYYSELAKRHGFDPFEVVGPHPAEALNPFEADYIRAHGGTPRKNGLPVGARLTEEQQGQFFAILKSQGQGPADEYLRSLGFQMKDPAAAKEPYSEAVDYSAVDASAQARIDALAQEQGGTDGLDAARRGAADGLFLGAADEIRAGVESFAGSMRGEGSLGDLYNQNLAAEQGYNRQLQDEHPWLYGTGQLVGGIVPGAVTFGASTPGQIARVGAGIGGAYGFNSGEGRIENRAISALEGAGAGAALGYALPKGVQMWKGRGQSAQVPPLVDPQTGELNQVLDALTPGQRVQAFRGAGIDTVTPGMAGGRSARIVEGGLNNLPGSAGTMEDVNSAVAAQARKAMESQADNFGQSRTLNEGGAELQRGARERIERSETVTGKAYAAIPIADNAPTTVNSSVAALQHMTQRFQSNPSLAEAVRDPKLNQYLEALQSGDLSWKDLKDFRSVIGEKIGEMRFGESSSTSDLRGLYAALSDDMRNSAAAQGPKALAAFNRANSLYANEQRLIEGALTRILGKDGNLAPERAAAAVHAMTMGGKSGGDIKTLAQIKAATVKSGAWDEIAATLIRLGGQPANSQGRAFQPDTFVRWYADMSEPARAMLFKPELRKSLDSFVAVSQQLARVKGLQNTSNTAPTMFGGGAMITAGGTVYDPKLGATLATVMAANWGTAKLWTSQKFVNWATGYVKAANSGNPNAVNSQLGRLSKLAATNPELRDPIQKMLATLANDNAPMAGGIAASPNERPEDEAQRQ